MEGYIPQNERKKILFLADDFRMPSGVGVMSREIIVKTAHRLNWVQVGAAVQHPEQGHIVDMSQAINEECGLTDAYVRIYPYSGYGDAGLIRTLIMTEKPDAILHFTDPRYWVWLYQMEHEIRELMPIMFYHVWDDVPFPYYNENYYRSCDSIFTISKQTHNIVRNVLERKEPNREPWQLKYIPHGINHQHFYKLTDADDLARLAELKKKLFGTDDVEFVVTYVNRNIQRKKTSDLIIAHRKFVLGLPAEKRDKVRLLLHTQPVDDAGTDLLAVVRDLAPEIKVVFSADRVDTKTMNDLFNVSDVVINIASAEGFGIGTMEGILAERMIIANVTGGLQDQMGFRDENGDLLHEDKHYSAEWPSNHDGRYREHGEWAIPVFPNNISLVGSPSTPYIYDDRCDWREAATALRAVYDLGPDERARRGALGRQYALENGFTSEQMAARFIDGIEDTFKNWKPRKRFTIVKG